MLVKGVSAPKAWAKPMAIAVFPEIKEKFVVQELINERFQCKNDVNRCRSYYDTLLRIKRKKLTISVEVGVGKRKQKAKKSHSDLYF